MPGNTQIMQRSGVDVPAQVGAVPVLVVVADAARRKLLTDELDAWGHAPQAVADTASAIAVLAVGEADGHVILVDGRDHARDAIACCRVIRDRTAPACAHYLLILAHADAALLPEAFAVGATCLMMTEHDASLLRARLLAITQRSRRQMQQQAHLAALTQAHQAMKQDLHELVAIQQMYLPDRRHRIAGIEFDWIYRPAFIVSGDHIGLIRLSPTQIAFCMIDVMGHGIAAAMRALEMARTLSLHPNEGILRERHGGGTRLRQPAEVARLLNESFKMTEASPIYCTLVYGVMDLVSGEGCLVQAGHSAPLRIAGDGSSEVLGEGGFPIGLIDDPGYEDISFRLQPGDRLFLYSDGITESADPAGHVYGDQRLRDCLARLEGAVGRQLAALDDDVNSWVGSSRFEQHQDDVSMLLIRYDGQASSVQDARPTHAATGWHAGAASDDTALRDAVASSSSRDGDSIRTLLLSSADGPWMLMLPELAARGLVVDLLPLDDERLDRVVLAQYQLILIPWLDDLTRQRALLERVMEVRQVTPIYVLAFSFAQVLEAELDALQAGADDFVIMPLSVAELKCRIQAGRQWIARDRILREALRQQLLLNEHVLSDLQVIETFQKSRFPRQGALHGEVEWGWLYASSAHASPNQIGISVLDDHRIAFFSLHSLRPGMLTLVNNWATSRLVSQEIEGNLLHETPGGEVREPARVLAEINTRYQVRKLAEYLCSMTYGVLDTVSGEGCLAHVGEQPPLLLRADGGQEIVAVATPELGSAPLEALVDYPFSLGQGDRLVMFNAGSGHASGDVAAVTERLPALAASEREPLLRRALSDLDADIGEWRRGRLQGAPHDLSLLALQRGIRGMLSRRALTSDALRAEPFLRLCHAMRLTPSVRTSHGIAISTPSLDGGLTLDIGRAAGDFAIGQGLSSVDSYFIDLAVVEASTNIFRHGYEARSDAKLEVWLIAHEGGVLVRLIDQGSPIPDACLEAARRHVFPETHEALEDVAEGGMGLSVIFKTMDAVHYESARTGNSLLLFKRATIQPSMES